MSSKGIKVKTESLEANGPADAITDYAQQKGMELIVMSTHGYSGFKKLMMGSVAFGVLNESHVPVLLIRTRGLPAFGSRSGRRRVSQV